MNSFNADPHAALYNREHSALNDQNLQAMPLTAAEAVPPSLISRPRAVRHIYSSRKSGEIDSYADGRHISHMPYMTRMP